MDQPMSRSAARAGHLLAWGGMCLAALLLVGCWGHQGKDKGTPARSKPVVWELTPEAQATYVYLLHDQAMRHEDEAELMEALRALRPFRPPVGVYVETAIWLMGRRSVEAESVVRMGLEDFPDNTSLNLLYAEMLQGEGHGSEAQALMEGFLRRFPDNVDAKLEYVLLLVKAGRHAEAEKVLRTVQDAGRSGLVEYYHARALIGMGRDQEAIPRLEKAIRKNPGFVEAMAELAFIYNQNKEYAKARRLYENMLKSDDAGPEVFLQLVSISLRMEQPRKAMEFLERSPERGPRLLYGAAALFFEARQYAYAEALLREIVQKNAATPEVAFLMAATVFEARHDMAEALRWLERIPPDAPQYERAILLRAQMFAEQDKNAEALQLVHDARMTNPGNKNYWDMEIRFLASVKGLPEACALAKEAHGQFPADADMAFMFASLLDETGNKKDAYAVMENILRDNPNHSKAMNYIGYTLAEESRDLERAMRLLTRAVELEPGADYIWDSLAWAQFKAGNTDDAWDSIVKATELNNTTDPTIWEHYADIALARGDKAAAQKGYARALDAKPGNSENIKDKLRGL